MNRNLVPVFLTPPVAGRSIGDHADDDPVFGWVQNPEQYLGMILLHDGTFRLNGRSFEVAPYDFVLATPGSRCEIERRGEPPYQYIVFAFQLTDGNSDAAWLPLWKSVPDGEVWVKLFTRAIRRVAVTLGMFKAIVPAFLWSIAEFTAPSSRNVYVADAERIISERLGDTLRVSDLAKEVGISQSQLSRHFLVETGSTPMQYILERRSELAHRLLTTTSLPIKEVAKSCGFPDTHAFGRFVRDRIGASPRALRSRPSNSR